jgi:hypothetical protein
MIRRQCFEITARHLADRNDPAHFITLYKRHF